MNIWSRFGNILYLVLGAQKRVEDFDTYFESVYSQDWGKYIPKDYEVVIKATSIKSELGSLSTLQSLAKKAIVKKLLGQPSIFNSFSQREKETSKMQPSSPNRRGDSEVRELHEDPNK